MTGFDRRTVLKAGLAATGGLALGLGSGAFSPASAAPRIDRTLAKGLGVPWGMAFLPSGNALVGERDTGDLHVVKRGGGRHRVGHLDAFSQVSSAGESGLLGLALHPGFSTNRWVYAYLSTSHDNRIVRRDVCEPSRSRAYRTASEGPQVSDHVADGARRRVRRHRNESAVRDQGVLQSVEWDRAHRA